MLLSEATFVQVVLFQKEPNQYVEKVIADAVEDTIYAALHGKKKLFNAMDKTSKKSDSAKQRLHHTQSGRLEKLQHGATQSNIHVSRRLFNYLSHNVVVSPWDSNRRVQVNDPRPCEDVRSEEANFNVNYVLPNGRRPVTEIPPPPTGMGVPPLPAFNTRPAPSPQQEFQASPQDPIIVDLEDTAKDYCVVVEDVS